MIGGVKQRSDPMNPATRKRRVLTAAAVGAVLMTAPLWPVSPKVAPRIAAIPKEQAKEPVREEKEEAALPPQTDESLDASQERLRQMLKDREAAKNAPQERLGRFQREGMGLRIGDPLPPAFMEKGRLGIRIQAVPEETVRSLKLPNDRGILITDVMPDTPAEKAGFRPDDILMEFAGKKVNGDPSMLTEMILALKGDMPYEALVLRDRREMRLSGIKLPGFGNR